MSHPSGNIRCSPSCGMQFSSHHFGAFVGNNRKSQIISEHLGMTSIQNLKGLALFRVTGASNGKCTSGAKKTVLAETRMKPLTG